MAHIASDKRSLRARIKRVRKVVAGHAAPGQPSSSQSASSQSWVTALARVKKHIQAESRHISHSD